MQRAAAEGVLFHVKCFRHEVIFVQSSPLQHTVIRVETATLIDALSVVLYDLLYL